MESKSRGSSSSFLSTGQASTATRYICRTRSTRLANVLSCNVARWSDTILYTHKQSSLSHRSRSPSTIGPVCHVTDARLPASIYGPVSHFGRRVRLPDGDCNAQCGKPPSGAAYSGLKVLRQTYFPSLMLFLGMKACVRLNDMYHRIVMACCRARVTQGG